ncbi:DUF3450 domain-containing protein [Hydrocarboniphaga sp.]|uniref:DUF3450 domain-containing protein n=1 Tax=Hydrocarboniphaga sp. TaxID=2033016 RepID=UPI00260675A5|nr:DUF3450 domain-containing protein [Hydrocarboniphaga sp.]
MFNQARWRAAISVAVLSAGVTTAVAADPVGQALDATTNANRASRDSQARIDQLDDATQAMLERYRSASWQSQQLKVYADQLEELAKGQEAERDSLQRQLTEIDRTERELLPLMLRMTQGLESIVASDLPFLHQERQERVDSIKRLMADPSASNADKFKRILEAYQIEAEYGRTLGAERTQVENRSVDVLRVGRTALFYLSTDGREAGWWDAAKSSWQPLDSQYITPVRRGLRMARETLAPDLLQLPMPQKPAGARS